MEFSQPKMVRQLERVRSIPVTRMIYDGESCRKAYVDGIEVHVSARMMLCMTGRMHLRTNVNNAGFGEVTLLPGQLVWASPRNRILELWDTTYEMFGVIFNPSMLRLLYITHQEGQPAPEPAPNPTLYYHTPKQLNPVGQTIVSALNQCAILATPTYSPPGSRELLMALLQNIQADVAACKTTEIMPNRFLWNEMFNYVSEHFGHPELNREQIARQYHVHPDYVSRLFHDCLGMGFVEYINKLRFDLAAEMLRDPTLHVDEIAEACGFRYASYFIRGFRKRFNSTPGQFRAGLH